MVNWHILGGLLLALAGWYLPRLTARAPLSLTLALPIDVAPALVGFIVFAAISARPIFAGVLIFAVMGGLTFTDWVKRETLREPVVFADLGELVELFRHPNLYLPFAGPRRVIAGAAATFGLFIVILLVEPPAWPWSAAIATLIPGLVLSAGWALHGPLIDPTAQLFRRLKPTGDPVVDASAIGPSAMQFTYSLIARSERISRRAQANRAQNRPIGRSGPAVIAGRSASAMPIMVMQSESFFDARRLHPGLAPDLLPAFDSCLREGVQWGRLGVPGWGANTMRTEFAVLTGLSEEALGYDRFNPYFAFARQPVSSLASRLRAQGYRTICVHSFDRTFYRRDQVMKNLGFDVFLGEESFAGASRSAGYIADTEVARVMTDLLREEGPHVFLFAITMENHGPWNTGSAGPVGDGLVFGLPPIPERTALGGYLSGLKNADASLGMLAGALSARGGPGLCAFYGDHQPSFPAAFTALDFDDPRSDYVIWRTDGGPGTRRDLAAHQLPDAILDALQPLAEARAINF